MGKETCRVVLVAALPPPVHGNTVWARDVLSHFHGHRTINLIHFNLSDHRSIENIGRFDWLNVWLALKQVFSFPLFIRRRRPNVVHVPLAMNTAGFLRDGLLILGARLFCRAAIVVHLHGAHFLDFYRGAGAWLRFFINRVMNSVDLPVVLGENLRHLVSPWFRVEDVAVVHNGVIRRLFQSPLPQRHNRCLLTVGFLGNLVDMKGLVQYVRVLAKMINDGLPVRGEVIGAWYDDQFRHEINSYCHEQGVSERILFRGALFGEEKLALMKEWDIFFYPSHTEGMPLVVLEAMALGLPVVVTNVGAVKDIVEDGREGFVVEKGDEKAMRHRLEALSLDESVRLSMSTAARQTISSRFDLDMNLEKLAVLWHRLFDSSHRGHS